MSEERIYRYKKANPNEPDFSDEYLKQPIDRLEKLLTPIWNRHAKQSWSEAARLAFVKQIRLVINIANEKKSIKDWLTEKSPVTKWEIAIFCYLAGIGHGLFLAKLIIKIAN